MELDKLSTDLFSKMHYDLRIIESQKKDKNCKENGNKVIHLRYLDRRALHFSRAKKG